MAAPAASSWNDSVATLLGSLAVSVKLADSAVSGRDSAGAASTGVVALSSWMAFSTSSSGVGCSVDTGASSFCASASFVAHLRWNCNGVAIRDCLAETAVKDVIVLGRAAIETDREVNSRTAAWRKGNLIM